VRNSVLQFPSKTTITYFRRECKRLYAAVFGPFHAEFWASHAGTGRLHDSVNIHRFAVRTAISQNS
jgi:hypothetical protein